MFVLEFFGRTQMVSLSLNTMCTDSSSLIVMASALNLGTPPPLLARLRDVDFRAWVDAIDSAKCRLDACDDGRAVIRQDSCLNHAIEQARDLVV